MSAKTAKAEVVPVRQRTQYSCMSASMMMCLKALGHQCDEDEVNKVMGATPMKGAAWENALACAQHYGCRATLTSPATVSQLKEWTDAGKPIMIAWNPEGREWSHASVVYDVTEGLPESLDPTVQVIGDQPGRYVWVADPNLPNPEKLVRAVHEDEFYKRWYEKWPRYLVRRPAMAIEREITSDGRQVMASRTASTYTDNRGQKWGPKRGLEGPFKYKTGVVLYYDVREGKYYDPSTDMYVTVPEFMSMTGEFPKKAGYTMTAKDGARHVRKLTSRFAEEYAANLSKSERSAILDYIVSTRMRTPRNSSTEAAHRNLTEAQKVLLGAGRLASTLALRVAARYASATGWAPNPHARKHTFETFVEGFYGGQPPPLRVARQFWDDFQNAFVGSLDEYAKAARR